MDDYRTLLKDVEKARENIERYSDKMWKVEQKKDNIEYDIEVLDGEIDDHLKQVNDHKQTYKEWAKRPDEYFAKFYGASKKDRLKDQQKQIDLWVDGLKKLESKKAVMQSNVKDLEDEWDAMDEVRYDKVDIPFMANKRYRDYVEYMDNYSYEEGSMLDHDIFMFTLEGQPELPEPPEYSLAEGTQAIEDHMRESGMLDDAPFNDYEFGAYGDVTQTVGSKTWAIEPDETLPENGVEVKSPPMPLPDFMKILPKMFAWISKWGDTTRACGFHVHMGVKGESNLEGKINYLKMLLFLDEQYIWNVFSDRMKSSYVIAAKEKLGQQTYVDNNKIFDKKKIIMKLSTNHYDAINFEHAEDGHIEFRHMGSSGYHKKLNDVKKSIAHFSHNVSIGLDPEFKKKEYALKLKRILNKMELFMYERMMAKFKGMVYDKDSYVKYGMDRKDQMGVEVIMKTLEKKIKPLKAIYKVDRKIHGHLARNATFLSTVNWEFDQLMKKYLSKNAIIKLNEL
jgi:hypothetical protein